MSDSKTNNSKNLIHPKYWIFWCILLMTLPVVLLPYRMRYKLSGLIGNIIYSLLNSRRKIASTNLKKCLQIQDIKKLTRKVMQENVYGLIELCYVFWIPTNWQTKHYTINGLQLLATYNTTKNTNHSNSNHKKGTIVIGTHMTTLDITGALLGKHIQICAHYRPLSNPVFNFMMEYARKKWCKQLYKKHDIRSVLKGLKQGHSTWYPIDQDYGIKHAVFTDFFGQSAATSSAILKLQQASNANLVNMSHIRDKNGHYHIELEEITLPEKNDKHTTEETTLKNMQHLTQYIEQNIRKDPSQYMWVHRRFKTQPTGQPSFYE